MSESKRRSFAPLLWLALGFVVCYVALLMIAAGFAHGQEAKPLPKASLDYPACHIQLVTIQGSHKQMTWLVEVRERNATQWRYLASPAPQSYREADKACQRFLKEQSKSVLLVAAGDAWRLPAPPSPASTRSLRRPLSVSVGGNTGLSSRTSSQRIASASGAG